MIDTHAHINTEKFHDDIDQVIQNAKDVGLENIIIPGIEKKEFDSLFDLVNKYPDYLYCGVGVHPHSAGELDDELLSEIEKLAQHQNVVAIGETGLDYYYDFVPKDVQKMAFRKQLQLAKKLGKPVIIHNRDSDHDLLDIIEQEQDGSLQGVIHCFSSGMETMERAIDLGLHISYTGNVTFKKFDRMEVVAQTPLDRIMIETDSPYMAPVPKRGKRNEPSYVKYVAEKIAEIKNINLEEFITMTSMNARKLFKLPVLIFLMLSLSSVAYAQDEEEEEEYLDDKYNPEAYLDEEKKVKESIFATEDPYSKTLGFGLFGGTNVIIKNLYLEDANGNELVKEESQPAIALFGANVNYHIFSWLNVQVAYFYSLNDNPSKKAIAKGLTDAQVPEDNVHQVLELSGVFLARSYSSMNFYATLGGNIFLNSIDGQTNTNSGILFGIGLQYNVDFGTSGVMTVGAEIKFDFELAKTENTFSFTDKDKDNPGQFITTEVTEVFRHQFTTPRLTIIYYPNLW